MLNFLELMEICSDCMIAVFFLQNEPEANGFFPPPYFNYYDKKYTYLYVVYSSFNCNVCDVLNFNDNYTLKPM